MKNREHSPVGASNCERWWNCPGSVQLISDCAPVPPNLAGLKGSKMHFTAEIWLREAPKKEDLEGISVVYNGERFEPNGEEYENIKTYVNFIQALVKSQPCGEYVIEKKIELPFDEDGFGTADFVLSNWGGTVFVVDYKSGVGTTVQAKYNKQMLYYSIGAVKDIDFDKLAVIIVQPDAKDGYPFKIGGLSFQSIEEAMDALKREDPDLFMSPEGLESFSEELKSRMIEAKDPENSLLKMGAWCRYCPASANRCSLQNNVEEVLLSTDCDKDLVPGLSVERIQALLSLEEAVMAKFKDIKGLALNMAKSGEKIPGYKLTLISKRKVLEDTPDLRTALQGVADPAKIYRLETATNLKKLGKEAKKIVEENLVKPLPNPDTDVILVPEGDSRAEYSPLPIEDMMDDVAL
jgi:hypothetical protein